MEWIKFEGKIPSHMSCEITHNEHKNYYNTIKEYLDSLKNGERPPLNELSDEEYHRCIKTDELWQIRWHPITPISSNVVYAPTLEECFKKIEANPRYH